MSKRIITAIIIAVAIISTLTTKAIDRSGGMEPYILNIIHSLLGDVKSE
jgi:hypothetical protein